MRAVSGAGKTTIVRCIVKALENQDITVNVHSTDDYFVVNGRYCFEIDKLPEYHKQNLEGFISSMDNEIDVVICDNTNLLPWQSEPYTDAARESGYQIIFINFLPRSLEEHVKAQKPTPEKPDAHNLSEELLIRFIDDFNTYNDLLSGNNEINPDKHFSYFWDTEKNERKRTDSPIKNFDADMVIDVSPDGFHHAQQTIVETLINCIVKG